MANTYLQRTFSTPTSSKIMTFSAWIKRGKIGATGFGGYGLLNTAANASGNGTYMQIGGDGNDRLQFSEYTPGETFNFKTNRALRDTSAWYHIVIAYDSTQATSSDRVKFYINGVQETSFQTANYPSLNLDTELNSAKLHYIGNDANAGGAYAAYYDGSMSHIQFIDGTAYDATAFGEYDANGVWKIKTSPSVTYGTNGFFILKDGNSVTDQSGNSNNFTVGGGTLTNTEDSPSNVFATLNPLVKPLDYTLSNGNNTITYGSATSRGCCLSTLGMSSGKFYAELKVTATSTTPCQASVGIANNSDNTNSGYYPSQGNSDNAASYQFWDGTKNVGAVGATYGASVAANDIMGFAFDIDNKAMYVSKNGVWQASGVPTSGASKTNAIDFSSITDNGFWFLIIGDGSGTQTFTSSFNFGNGYFGTTAVASAGTNASGIGIFEYDVPTGFTALSTKGLNL